MHPYAIRRTAIWMPLRIFFSKRKGTLLNSNEISSQFPCAFHRPTYILVRLDSDVNLEALLFNDAL